MKRYLPLILLTILTWRTASAQPQVPQALRSYIETALVQNPEVLASRAKWAGADARADKAQSLLLPTLDFTARFTGFSGGRIVEIPNVGSFNTAGLGLPPWDNKFEMVWPIGNYAIWMGDAAADAFRDAATAEVKAKELSTTFTVSEAYYNCAKASELVTIRKNALYLAEENLRIATALFNSEKVAKNDILRAEVGVAVAEGELIQAKGFESIARTRFNSLLKRKNDAEVQLPSPQEVEVLANASKELTLTSDKAIATLSLPPLSDDAARALSMRPEIEQLNYSEDALRGVKRVSGADYFPNIALFASYGWQETSLQFSSQSDNLIGGVQLRWNLFSGFGTNAKVREAESQLEEIRYQRESAVSGIQLEVENARTERVVAADRLVVAHKQLASAEENYRITKVQYDNGTMPLITLLDAETVLSNAKANLATTTYDVLIADAKYRKALGIR
jgi:outer membrane protein